MNTSSIMGPDELWHKKKDTASQEKTPYFSMQW
jgi:hypothetical protein